MELQLVNIDRSHIANRWRVPQTIRAILALNSMGVTGN